MRTAAALVLVGALVAAYVALEWLSDPFESTTRYATRADAEADGAFARGWLPDHLPEVATDICEFHSLDTNEVCVTFSIPRDVVPAFLTATAERGFAPVAASSSAGRCEGRDACGFSHLRCAVAALVSARAVDGRRAYVAVDPANERVCYWVTDPD